MTPAERTVEQLRASGYLQYVALYQPEGSGVRGRIAAEALRRLGGDERFASGLFYGMHLNVGDHLTDFRSYNGAFGKGSLQIVIDGETGAFFADVDRCNPYQDVVNFVGHAFGEVLPGVARGLWRRIRGK